MFVSWLTCASGDAPLLLKQKTRTCHIATWLLSYLVVEISQIGSKHLVLTDSFLWSLSKSLQTQGALQLPWAILGAKPLLVGQSKMHCFLDLGMVGLPPNSTPGCTWYWRNTWSSQVSFEKKTGMVKNRWWVLESFQIKYLRITGFELIISVHVWSI